MPRFHLALKAAFGYMLRAYPARDRRAEVRNARRRPFSRFFRNSPTAEYRSAAEPARDTTAPCAGRQPRPRNREAEVRRPAVCVRRPKVFGAIGTGGASGNALRILRSPPPLQRSFNGLIISFPKISGIWGFHKFSFIFPKSNFAIIHTLLAAKISEPRPPRCAACARALIAPGTWAERRPNAGFYAVPARPPAGFPQNRFAGRCVSRFFREAAVRFPPAFAPEEKIRKICLQFM